MNVGQKCEIAPQTAASQDEVSVMMRNEVGDVPLPFQTMKPANLKQTCLGALPGYCDTGRFIQIFSKEDTCHMEEMLHF